MYKSTFAILILLLLLGWTPPEKKAERPNIILILADDLGYGDPRCYNPNSKIPTPHIDQLASEGVMFTDAHTNSSVCTPTRYGILTGQYSWRGPLEQGVTWSYDSLIINRQSSTTASILQQEGYRTACIGKWHLGLGWPTEGDSVQFDQPLSASPVDVGFDYFYGIAASLDIPPYVYIENNRVVEQPQGTTEGTSPTYKGDFWRKGPVSPDFNHYQVLNHLTQRAEQTIRQRAAGDEPFFVYFPLTAPHLPWIPRDEFRGRSQAGNYGDLTAEVDQVVGRINDLVKELGIEEETLIIFTSDNGSQFSSENINQYNHRANGPWRGRKGDIYEGGHRVPFIVKWPGKAEAGRQSDQLVSVTDFYATFADITGTELPTDEIKDSYSFLPAVTNRPSDQAMRNEMVYHSAKGLFAFRQNDWVLIKGKGSGGFLEVPDTTRTEEPYQLYHLPEDRSQAHNRSAEKPTKVNEMKAALQQVIHRPEAEQARHREE